MPRWVHIQCITTAGGAATPNLIVEQKEVCRLDFTRDYDESGTIDWIDAGRFIADRMPAKVTDYFNDRIIYNVNAQGAPANVTDTHGINATVNSATQVYFTLEEFKKHAAEYSNLIDNNPSMISIAGWSVGGHDVSFPVHYVNTNIIDPDALAKARMNGNAFAGEDLFKQYREDIKEWNVDFTPMDNWDDQYNNVYSRGVYDSRYITRWADNTLRQQLYPSWAAFTGGPTNIILLSLKIFLIAFKEFS